MKRLLCALAVLTGGGPSAFGVYIFIYALVFPYIFLLNSEENAVFYDSVDWGVHLSLSLNDTNEQ